MIQTTNKNESAWNRHAWIAYLAVFIGVIGHASSEFVAKIISNNSAITGPEISVWRFFFWWNRIGYCFTDDSVIT